MMFLAILPTVLLVAYSQLIVKWRVVTLRDALDANAGLAEKLMIYALDPIFISAYAAALLGSFAWIFVVSRYEISVAFPTYIGVIVLLVTLGGAVLFNEALNPQKVLALGLIILGVVLVSRA